MWEENENFILYISPEFKQFANLAIFSFEDTLVGKTGGDTVEIFSDNVTTKLKNISAFVSIIIVENNFSQKETKREPKRETQKEIIKKNLLDFLEMIPDVPVAAIFILRANRYMKPLTNVAEIISEKIMEKTPIDLAKSLVVGNNAGRFRTGDNEADCGDCDRAFANNLGVPTFRTPEQFFDNAKKPRKWQWKMSHISQLMTEEKEPHLTFLAKHKSPLIFITGALCSGKSSLASRIAYSLHGAKIVDINKKNLGEMFEAILAMPDREGGLIVVDILYNDVLLKYYDIIRNMTKNTPPIFIIDINASSRACLFLNKFKLQITKNSSLLAHTQKEIEKWFTANKLFQNSEWCISREITYIKFPLELRTRSESFYRY